MDRGRMARSVFADGHAAAASGLLQGVGVGLRYPHHEQVLASPGAVDFFEIHAENYLSGIALDDALEIRRSTPLSIHATGLSLGSAHGVSREHVERIAGLCALLEPAQVSDHISWSGTGGGHVPDLLPLPYTEEALDVCAVAIQQVQDGLRRRILVENPSRYLAYAEADFSEAQFLAELVDRTGCGVLLDLNNILVSASNLGLSPASELRRLLSAVPAEAIGELHVAGHAIEPIAGGGALRIDDHGSAVSADVWHMLDTTTRTIGARPVLVEWDTNIPAFETLCAEASKARHIVSAIPEYARAAC
jgi:uncharacterized protein (UPF0276 family)